MKLTNKQFRAIINTLIPAGSPDNGKGEHGRFKPSKRAYGDYLWFQDRDMFLVEKAAFEDGSHNLLKRPETHDAIARITTI